VIGRIERLGAAAATVGLLASAAGFLVSPAQFYRSYLFGYLFWVGMALGCLLILMISHLTGGMWGLVVRRLLEAGTRTLALLALLFLPIAFGMEALYPWARPEAAADPILRGKALYLNVPFFLGRAAFYFAAWIALAHLLNTWSLKLDQLDQLDQGESLSISVRLRGLSGGGLVVLALTITFSAVDWAMSLAPHSFSTIYGILFIVGQALSALALAIILVALLAEEMPIAKAIRPDTVHDLGKLLLAFTMLWAYVNLSQFLIVWSGNVAEETPIYVRRLHGGWQWVGLLLVIFHFALPFLLLLSRDLKRNARLLGSLAGAMLLVRFVDLFWLVGPDLTAQGHEAAGLTLHWLDVAAPMGIGGLWLYWFARQLRGRPLLPVGEREIRDLLGVRADAVSS